MVVGDGEGLPVGIHLESASPAEVKLLEPTLQHTVIPHHALTLPNGDPVRMILDLAYDSDAFRWRMAQRGIEVVCPHRRNRRRPSLQDGRALRRYRRRWKIERMIAWLGNFRRLVVRYERNLLMYRAFVHVACLLIIARQF